MASSLTTQLIVRVIDNASGPARRIGGALRGLAAGAMGATRGGGLFDAAALGVVRDRLLAIGAALGGIYAVNRALTSSVTAAMNFESAMADVKKVVDFESPKALKDFEKSIIGMSKRVPMAAQSLTEIVAAAGQAGIAREDLLKFTEMAAKIGVAFDISAGVAGESMAKMMTGLGLSVDEVGKLADAMNHLSNSQASTAAEILDVVRRVGSSGKLFGFSATQTSAFASAMIAAGAQSDVAATSFNNMGRALVKGATATKAQRDAYKKLGLDAKAVAKRMQKDAVATTIDVLERINKLPKEMQASTASALFGDEARALMPLIANLDLLKTSLGLVSKETNYLGSATREYDARSKTFANSVQLFRNRLNELQISIGNNLMPILSRAMNALVPYIDQLNEVFSTLDQRVSVFDRIGAGIQGFAKGLGFEGAGDAFKSLLEAIFGSTKTFEADVDAMGATFEKFRSIAASIREFIAALGEMVSGLEKFLGVDQGAIGSFIADAAGWGAMLAASAVGISVMAGALGGLARSIMFLTGITTAGKILKLFAALRTGADVAGAGAAAAGAAGAGAGAAGKKGLLGTIGAGVGAAGSWLWKNKAMAGGAGAAIAGGYALGEGIKGVGEIAGGKYWTPKDQEEVASLTQQLEEVNAKIKQIRETSKVPEMAESLVAPLLTQAADLENRIKAFNEMSVRPNVDSSAIDAAKAKVDALRASLNSIGSGGGGGTIAGKSASSTMGARARGGPISRGNSYLVGERGPEIITANRAATVLPNSALGGGGASVTVSPTIQISGAQDPTAVAAQVRAALDDYVRTALRGVFADTGIRLA